MSIENQPTQRIRRPDDGSTDVLSLDNLFEGPPAAEVTATPTQPVASTPPVEPAAPAAPAEPVASTPPVEPAEQPSPTPVERRMADRRVGDRRAGTLPAAPALAPR